MKILAIETSCDETAVALLDVEEGKEETTLKILGNGLLSQVGFHSPLGGVVPSLAKREHSKNLIPMFTIALKDAGVLNLKLKPTPFDKETESKLKEIFSHEPGLCEAFVSFIPTLVAPPIDCIAVTQGPGLEPALWVGINFAKALRLVWKKPVVAVNHMEGHILSSMLIENGEKTFVFKEPKFPLLSLLISGGHTELVLAEKISSYKILGETRDDAVGEAFDKVARMLELPYPGGPQISKLAEEARMENLSLEKKLPRPMIHTGDLNFSFSGLKTAVLYTLKNKYGDQKLYDISYSYKKTIAREFEDAVTEVLVSKVRKALRETRAKTLVVGGGVIANKNIRKELDLLTSQEFPGVELFLPTPTLTTDNAVMIGLAGYFKFKEFPLDTKELEAKGNWRLS